jgi:hypothetical protein
MGCSGLQHKIHFVLCVAVQKSLKSTVTGGLVSPANTFGHFPVGCGKVLKDFKQGNDMIQFVFCLKV